MKSYWVHRCISIRLISLYSQAYWYGVLSVQVRIYISIRLVRSQDISVTIVIGLIAATNTSRFESAEDREYISVISVY